MIKYISLFYLFQYYNINAVFKRAGFMILFFLVVFSKFLRYMLLHPLASKTPIVASKMLIHFCLALLIFVTWYGMIIEVAKPFFKLSSCQFNISGHCFLLIWTVLDIPSCIALVTCHMKYQSRLEQAFGRKKMRHVIKTMASVFSMLSFIYLVLVSLLLSQTFLFFHSFSEKLVGGTLAVSGHTLLLMVDLFYFY